MSKSKLVRLTAEQVKKLHSNISPAGWKLYNGNCLARNYTFKNFEDTWAFLTKVALRSHLTGHHPKLTTVYNKVDVELTTHDVQGLTEIDFKFAERFENYAAQIGQK
ncbi:hypothetical protein OGAPHI_000157 [Ogataea philodendri]|uniref:4a-hydroxytetrahydrobiopterin dehydratase n=1 Tax=Ogataea philodendri TaxID=1378263 RepID=A0A9P8TAJ5_9ASCO|nr:uncharacterized protein OGAPHI_000157 [Ogataea philodendri]KAH3671971.1 hypothetical protein OGAPHI_000157 [Ogataea philodendri]